MATVRPAERSKRTFDESRKMEMTWGGLSRADGSARFHFGKTGCITSVSGPIEVRLNAELPSKATLEVSMRQLAGVPATSEKRYSKDIRDILEQVLVLTQHPRTLVQIVIQATSAPISPPWQSRSRTSEKKTSTFINPSLLAAYINATSLALLNGSSVPMRGVLCAAAVGKLPSGVSTRYSANGRLVLDPEEGEYGDGYLVCALLFEMEKPKVIWVLSEGLHEIEEYTQALELATKGANGVLAFFRKEIGDTLSGTTEGVVSSDSTKMEIS